MQIGMTYEMDEEKLQADTAAGKTVLPGVPLRSLADEISTLEIKHNYDFKAIVSELKLTCLMRLGLVKVEQPEAEPEEQQEETAPQEPVEQDLLNENGNAR